MRPRTIVALDEWLTKAARKRPAHPALEAEGRSVTFAELDARAARAARILAGHGVRPGDRVATTLPAGHAFAELLHALPRLGAVLVPLDPREPACATSDHLVEAPLDGREADVELRTYVDPDAVHSVIHTSGTSGRAKPVELTYANHHASALASAAKLGVEPDDAWLCPLPLFHVGGLAVLLRCAIYSTTAVLHERFDLDRVRGSLEGGEVTLASLVPTMLQRLRAAGLERAPRLRAVLLGGGPIPGGLLEWATGAGLPVRATYGMTETASQIATAALGERAAKPLEGAEVQIAPDGEILVRGPMVSRGALAVDGWLHTGDLGRLDEQGRLYVQGRLKEIIVTGGENVAPAEVEEVLLAHPGVLDAGVAGVPDDEWGEAVSAFVVLRDGAGTESLREWCAERLAAHKVPKRIERVHALPRNAAGKLLRDRL